MTAPGTIPPPAPGWWVKRNRVAFLPSCHMTLTGLAPTVRTGFTLAPARSSMTLTGFAPTIVMGGAFTPAACSMTLTGFAPTISQVFSPLSIVGTPAVAAAFTITLPTHAPGDIIVMFATTPAGTAPSAPGAGGTVPTWTTIDAGGDSNGAMRTAYAIASSSSHTSGTWTSAQDLGVIVLRGQNATTPIGGHGLSTGSNPGTGTPVIAPAITMTDTSGTSMLLHFFFGYPSAWSAAPAGYTQRASLTSGAGGVLLATKDSTTSDGSVSQAYTWNFVGAGYRGATIEILD